MAPTATRTAVLVSRFPVWLDLLEQALAPLAITVRGRAVSHERGLALVEEHQPELVVVDISDRMDVTWLCRARFAAAASRIVVSGLDDRCHIEAAFAAGADAYVLKNAQPADVALAIRQTFEPSFYLPTRRSTEAVQADTPIDLTRREREILLLVADGRSNGDVARTLWVTEQTVKFHLSNIYRKLDVTNRTEASRWAQVHGLLVSTTAAAPAAA
jgi:DNA-binding NarL/FixJ family response regulator